MKTKASSFARNTKYEIRTTKPPKAGLTLVELLMAGVMLAAVGGVAVYMFGAVIKTYLSQEARAGIDIDLSFRIEEVVRDLREASDMQSQTGYNEIRFSHNGADFYIYYFFNAGDSYPPAFDQDAYELRRTAISGDIDGTFTYGGGRFLLRDILPPPTSILSMNGNIATVDLSIKYKDETIRSRTQVRPRNL